MLRELPSEREIARCYAATFAEPCQQPLSVGLYETQIKEWLEEKYSFQVIHLLLVDLGVTASESTVRRWIHRHFPHLPSAVILRATVAGEVMEVDFGYLGMYWDSDTAKQRKVWFFSGRLRHSRRVYREITFDQSQGTFFRCHINAFEFFGGIPAKVTPDYVPRNIMQRVFSPAVAAIQRDCQRCRWPRPVG
jgi:hypothetical protein